MTTTIEGRGGAHGRAAVALTAGLALLTLLALGGGSGAAWLPGGGAGLNGGTAAGEIQVLDAFGAPGGTASVVIAVTTLEGVLGAAQLDLIFDGTYVSLGDGSPNCMRDPRLADQLQSRTFPDDQPAPPFVRARLGVFPPLDDPVLTFTDGNIFTCQFGIDAAAPLGEDVDVLLERLQLVRGDQTVICGVDSDVDCEARDGVIMIREDVPGTPTPTPTLDVEPTNTPDVPVPTNTPDGPVPTNTPDVPVPTNTPDGPVPTNTPDVPVPTSTPAPVTPLPTNTPVPAFAIDDSCAVVPVEQVSPLRSLLLLLGPALLLWGRRRGF